VTSQDVYRIAFYGDPDFPECDEDYEVLLGPESFECILTEPEDRTWNRDGRKAVDRLNEQHRCIAALVGERDRFQAAYELRVAEAEDNIWRANAAEAEVERLRGRLELLEEEHRAWARYLAAKPGEIMPAECEGVVAHRAVAEFDESQDGEGIE